MTQIRSNLIELTPKKRLLIEANNGKSLFIDTTSVAFIDVNKNKDGYITSVSFEDKKTISLGDKIEIPLGNVTTIYEVLFIAVQDDNKSVLLFSSIPTKTTTFLLPMLNKSKLQLKYDTYFVNAFLSKDTKHIILIYRFTGTNMYTEFEHSLMSDPLFIAHMDHNTYHVAYIFRIEERFKEDVDNFLNGKYSLFSKTLKERTQKFYGNTDLASTMKIINKDQGLRKSMEKHIGVPIPEDSELASIPELKEEIYNTE